MVPQNMTNLDRSALAKIRQQEIKIKDGTFESNVSSSNSKSRSPGGKPLIRRLFSSTGEMRVAGISQKRRKPHKQKHMLEDEAVISPQEEIYYSKQINRKAKSNLCLDEYEVDLQSEERSVIGTTDQNLVKRRVNTGMISEIYSMSNDQYSKATGPRAVISIKELS